MGQQVYGPGTYQNWTSPVSGTVLVECWGGGGSGGGGSGNYDGGGGGAGGQYAKKSVTVVKGTEYLVYVANVRAGVGQNTNGNTGYQTSFGVYASPTVKAVGGVGGQMFDLGAAGGRIPGCVCPMDC